MVKCSLIDSFCDLLSIKIYLLFPRTKKKNILGDAWSGKDSLLVSRHISMARCSCHHAHHLQ